MSRFKYGHFSGGWTKGLVVVSQNKVWTKITVTQAYCGCGNEWETVSTSPQGNAQSNAQDNAQTLLLLTSTQDNAQTLLLLTSTQDNAQDNAQTLLLLTSPQDNAQTLLLPTSTQDNAQTSLTLRHSGHK